jgi:hypothetical protein
LHHDQRADAEGLRDGTGPDCDDKWVAGDPDDQPRAEGDQLESGLGWVTNTHLAGWNWGAGDGVKRWGTNRVDSAQNGYIWFQFLPGTCTVSSGDSSGMVFVNDNGTPKLVGVIYAVGFTTWAMFDGRGVNGMSCSGPPVTSGFVCSRIADRIGWIESVVSGR